MEPQVAAMHARPRYPTIPVLVVSGYAAHLMGRVSVLQPAAVFLGKPYSLAKVVDALNRLTASLCQPRPS